MWFRKHPDKKRLSDLPGRLAIHEQLESPFPLREWGIWGYSLCEGLFFFWFLYGEVLLHFLNVGRPVSIPRDLEGIWRFGSKIVARGGEMNTHRLIR
jgi:hypothetical protein